MRICAECKHVLVRKSHPDIEPGYWDLYCKHPDAAMPETTNHVTGKVGYGSSQYKHPEPSCGMVNHPKSCSILDKKEPT